MNKSTAWRVLSLAKSERSLLSWGLLFLAISSAAGLVYPLYIKEMVDQALQQQNIEHITRISVTVWIVFIAQGIFSSLRYYTFTVAGERIVMRLRNRLYSHLLDLDVSFFDRHRTGELMSRLSTDATVLQNAVSVNISMAIRNLVGALGGLIMMIYTSGTLAFSILIIIPPVGVGIAYFGKRIRAFSKKSQEALGQASQVSEETLSGLRTVRSFAQEDFERSRFKAATDKSLVTAIQRIRQISLFMTLAFSIGFTAVSLVLWFGGRQVMMSHLTIGELTQFIIYLMLTAISVGALGGLWGDLMSASGAAARVFEILDQSPEVAHNQGTVISPIEGCIEFKNVSFSYPSRPGVNVLNNLSLTLIPHQTTAIVGPSGAGKSSIVSLLLRFYEPQEGCILLDGQPYPGLKPDWLRTSIGLVAQEPVLISASIRDNILYGNPSATNEQVLEAAAQANAHLFVEGFTDGYDTLVGEKGIQLSGGQKQRIAIARALLKNPKILILDEATSALDSESESLVQDALARLMKGRTTLVIAHRLSTIKDAHQILVLDKGTVVEKGRHNDLISQTNGFYARLIAKQTHPTSEAESH